MILHNVCMASLRTIGFPDFMLLLRKYCPLDVLCAFFLFMYDASELTCRIISNPKIVYWHQGVWHNNQEIVLHPGRCFLLVQIVV